MYRICKKEGKEKEIENEFRVFLLYLECRVNIVGKFWPLEESCTLIFSYFLAIMFPLCSSCLSVSERTAMWICFLTRGARALPVWASSLVFVSFSFRASERNLNAFHRFFLFDVKNCKVMLFLSFLYFSPLGCLQNFKKNAV